MTPHVTSQRRWSTAALTWLPASAAGLSAAAVLAGGPSVCPVALLTGVACPGCGLTRAVVALAQGDLSASWALHPLAGVVLGVAATFGLWWAAARLTALRPPSTHALTAVSAVLAAALVVTWAVRLVGGTLPVV